MTAYSDYWRAAIIMLGTTVKTVIDNRHTPEKLKDAVTDVTDLTKYLPVGVR